MTTHRKSSLRLVAMGALSALWLASCGSGSDVGRFTPAVDTAERALQKALDDWKAGNPVGPLEGTSPAVQVNDAGRKPEQVLAGYEILGETEGPPGRTFVVQLHLRNPDADERAKYIVVGIDPLHVFRQEDYDLLSHWDHHMPESKESEPILTPATKRKPDSFPPVQEQP